MLSYAHTITTSPAGLHALQASCGTCVATVHQVQTLSLTAAASMPQLPQICLSQCFRGGGTQEEQLQWCRIRTTWPASLAVWCPAARLHHNLASAIMSIAHMSRRFLKSRWLQLCMMNMQKRFAGHTCHHNCCVMIDPALPHIDTTNVTPAHTRLAFLQPAEGERHTLHPKHAACTVPHKESSMS